MRRTAAICGKDAPAKIRKLLGPGGWHLPPLLLLSFTGAEDGEALDLSAPAEAALTLGLGKVAQRANAWIVSGGLDQGASGLVGRAMAALAEPPRSTVLAVAPLLLVKHHERFLADKSHATAYMDLTTPEQVGELTKCKLEAVRAADGGNGNDGSPRGGLLLHDPSLPAGSCLMCCGEGGAFATCEQVLTELENEQTVPHHSDMRGIVEDLRRDHDELLEANGVGLDPAAILNPRTWGDSFDSSLVIMLKVAVVRAASKESIARKSVRYLKQDVNTPKSAQVSPKGELLYNESGYALDAHHGHYLLVDAPVGEDKEHKAETASGASTAEQLRWSIEEEIRQLDEPGEVPLVSVCVGGGERACGNLMRLIKKQAVVLIVAESGGIAAKVGLLVTYLREVFASTNLPTRARSRRLWGARRRRAPSASSPL